MKVPKSPPPPSLPPSRLNDDEDGSASTGAATLVNDSRTSNHDNQAQAYLFRYESMVRQQQAEDMATVAHLNPCICRLMELLGMEVNADDFNETFLCAEVSFEQLRLAFDILRQQQPREPMTTDRQLMMVLNILTQKVDLTQPEQNASSPFVTWAEIVQCYKICVSGMVTLQHLQNHPTHRARARDRTLAMLSLFEPPSTQLFHEDALSVRSSSTAMAALEEPLYLPRRKRRTTRRKKTMRSTAGTVSKGIGLCLAAAWVWNKSGNSDTPSSISSQYIALTQQGLPNPSVLAKQRTVTEYLLSVASSSSSKVVAEIAPEKIQSVGSTPSAIVAVDSLAEPRDVPTKPVESRKVSSFALLPWSPISNAIGELFTKLFIRPWQHTMPNPN